MRDIVRTINELPSDYSGKIDILLNDREPLIVLRNILLLLILGKVTDKVKAADIALHMWYSAFVPAEYDIATLSILVPFLDEIERSEEGEILTFSSSLGTNSTLSGVTSTEVGLWLGTMMGVQHELSDVAKELERVRCVEPSVRNTTKPHFLSSPQ